MKLYLLLILVLPMYLSNNNYISIATRNESFSQGLYFSGIVYIEIAFHSIGSEGVEPWQKAVNMTTASP